MVVPPVLSWVCLFHSKHTPVVVFPFLFACLRCVKCFSNSYHDKDDVYCDGNILMRTSIIRRGFQEFESFI